MAWVIIWVTVTVLLSYLYVEKIEKMKNDEIKIFSHLRPGGIWRRYGD